MFENTIRMFDNFLIASAHAIRMSAGSLILFLDEIRSEKSLDEAFSPSFYVVGAYF